MDAKLFTNSSFHNRFQSCVRKSETPEEFEGKWTAIIRDFELDEVEWLTFMYGMRDKWIPCISWILSWQGYERPELKTKLELERLMSEYYTHANFKLFQEELISCFIDCGAKIMRDEFPHKVFQVSESDKGARVREVAYNTVK